MAAQAIVFVNERKIAASEILVACATGAYCYSDASQATERGRAWRSDG
jgi:hypothetical protein